MSVGQRAVGHAVHQQRVDLIDSQFPPETFDVGLGHLGMLGRGLGLDEVLLAGDALQRQADEQVGLVHVGRVDVADAAIQGVADHPREVGLAHVDLIVAAVGAGAHAQHRRLDARLAQGDQVGSAGDFLRAVGPCGTADQRGRSDGGGRSGDEFTARDFRHG